MNFYITTENENYLRDIFMNFRFFQFISVENIKEELNLFGELDEHQEWILNDHIKKEIHSSIKKNNVYAIIYQNKNLDYEVIKNLNDYFKNNKKINNIILFDNLDDPKNEDLYQYFKEVIFFPQMKKIKAKDINNLKTLQIENTK